MDPGDQAMHILNALTFTSDQESLMLLARLRLGEAWVDIVGNLRSRQSGKDVGFQDGTTHNMESAFQVCAPEHPWPRTHTVTRDEIMPSRSYAQEDTVSSALIAPKPWLTGLFDRQYFRQVSYIYCTPRSASNAGNLGSQSSFGNMPFSSAIAANYHPAHVQEMQQHNFLVPIWAQRVLNDATIHTDPFHHIMAELRNDIANGVAVEELCGSHPYIAALDDADTYHRAPKLSQIAARTIASIKSSDASTTFTQYAMMYWFWALWRWLLCPTKETYSGIPEFARPTTSQLFVSHPPVFDFVLPPGLRDLVCQNETPNIQWFTEAAITIECHWDGNNLSALCRDGLTNEIDFNPICKVSELDVVPCYYLNRAYAYTQYNLVARGITRQLDAWNFRQIVSTGSQYIREDQMKATMTDVDGGSDESNNGRPPHSIPNLATLGLAVSKGT